LGRIKVERQSYGFLDHLGF